MPLPKELTTVTPLSKLIALILFVTLPFIAFFAGMRYQYRFDAAQNQLKGIEEKKMQTVQKDENSQDVDWKKYESIEYRYTIMYPAKVTHSQMVIPDPISNLVLDSFTYKGGTLRIYGVCGREVHSIKQYPFTFGGEQSTKFYETETTGLFQSVKRPLSNEYLCADFTLPSDPIQRNEIDKLFDTVLSTLQFITPSSSNSRVDILKHPENQLFTIYADLPPDSKVTYIGDTRGFLVSEVIVNGSKYTVKAEMGGRGGPCPMMEDDPTHCGYTDEKIPPTNALKEGNLRIWKDDIRGVFAIGPNSLNFQNGYSLSFISIYKDGMAGTISDKDVETWKTIIHSMKLEEN